MLNICFLFVCQIFKVVDLLCRNALNKLVIIIIFIVIINIIISIIIIIIVNSEHVLYNN